MIVSVVILIFCAVGLVAGAIPAGQKIKEQYDTMKVLADTNAAMQKRLDVLNSLDEVTLRNDLATAVSAVPGDKALPSIFSTAEALAVQAGVSLLEMSLSGGGALASASGAVKATATEKQLGTHIVPFTVTVEGSLPNIQQFIALAPAVRRLLRIRTFAITAPQGDKPLSISVEMDAFYEPFPTSVGGAGTSISPLSAAEESTLAKLGQFPLIGGETTVVQPAAVPSKNNPFSP
jgi:hypothetical protein